MNRKSHLNIIVSLILIAATAILCTACRWDNDDPEKAEVKTCRMDGTSMEPTLKNGQTLEYVPAVGMPSPGEIILFSHSGGYEGTLIKRVIAVAGQRLEIDYDNQTIRVDGKLLDESGYTQGYLKAGDISAKNLTGLIPTGKVFVLGDNRTVSLDSRYYQIGMVDVSDIIGVIVMPD